ncbi:MAG: PEP-CTERM sorting domain-containing protein [Thiohalocapsa sp.]|uniref:PEP-CTERM sorting domain-containing protein n=1 Tax=Thiohalocapsa sp. TaxID=2497641 RepID=UPI0025DF4DB2|nr:PEP-CTERM sorting domain-containing protein [Thiohalocapsa sp.]MCG6939799.1 PEP-CTERM sorting domain-containing protein [Thiohalocapsa sp.]
MRGLLPAVVVAAALVNPAHAGIVSTGSVSSDYTGASQISDWGTVGATTSVFIGSQAGPGTVTVDGGSTVTTNYTSIGYYNIASGSKLTVTGAGSSWSADNWITIGEGYNNDGALEVLNGASVSSSSSFAIGYNSPGSLLIDGGSVSIGGIPFLNRYSQSDGSTLTIRGGGTLTSNSALDTSYNNATVTIEDGLIDVSSVNSGDATSVVDINIGVDGVLSLSHGSGDATMANFLTRFFGQGTTNINLWTGTSYVPYTSLTEGVDYQVVADGSKWLLSVTPQADTPVPGTLALMLGGLTLVGARRRRRG